MDQECVAWSIRVKEGVPELNTQHSRPTSLLRRIESNYLVEVMNLPRCQSSTPLCYGYASSTIMKWVMLASRRFLKSERHLRPHVTLALSGLSSWFSSSHAISRPQITQVLLRYRISSFVMSVSNMWLEIGRDCGRACIKMLLAPLPLRNLRNKWLLKIDGSLDELVPVE